MFTPDDIGKIISEDHMLRDEKKQLLKLIWMLIKTSGGRVEIPDNVVAEASIFEHSIQVLMSINPETNFLVYIAAGPMETNDEQHLSNDQ